MLMLPAPPTVCSLFPSASVQSPSALLTGSRGVPSIQLEATGDDPFVQEMGTASVSSAAMTTATNDSSQKTREVTIPLEAKEPKRRGSSRNKRNQGEAMQRYLATRDRVESDSDGEGNETVHTEKRN